MINLFCSMMKQYQRPHYLSTWEFRQEDDIPEEDILCVYRIYILFNFSAPNLAVI